jgi:hypothetical protein
MLSRFCMHIILDIVEMGARTLMFVSVQEAEANYRFECTGHFRTARLTQSPVKRFVQ